MEYLIIGIASVIIIALLVAIYRYNQEKKIAEEKKKTLKPVKCPVCNSDLYVGENLITKVYRPMNVPDQLLIVSGCPHCFPKAEPGVHRNCPVCKRGLSQTETLTARLFNKKIGKKHVHIVGCSKCHKPRAD